MAPQSIPENPGFELVAVPRRRGLKQATRGARIAGMRLWTSVRNWFRSAAMEHGVDVGDFLIEAAAVGKGFVGWGRVRHGGISAAGRRTLSLAFGTRHPHPLRSRHLPSRRSRFTLPPVKPERFRSPPSAGVTR